MKDDLCVITFPSIYQALNFEKLLKKHNITVKLMPVPRELSSSCGSCGKIDCESKDMVLELCNNNGIEIDDFHRLKANQKKESLFEKLIKRKAKK